MRVRTAHTISAFLASMVVAAVMLMAITATEGCRHNVNTNNPKVIQAATLLDASDLTVTIEDGVVAANHAVEAIQASDPEYYNKVKPLLRSISSANVLAARKIQAFKNGDATADWRGAIIAVAGSVNTQDLSAVHIKNPNTQLIVSASLATLVAALETIPKKFPTTP